MSQTKAQLIARPFEQDGVEFTFPAAQGSAGQVLRNSSTPGTLEFGALGSADLPAGCIIQTVHSTNETSISNSSTTTYIKSNQTVTITPIRSNSHLLVLASLTCQNVATSSTAGGVEAHIRYEDTTGDLFPLNSSLITEYGTDNHVGGNNLIYLDTSGSWSGAVQYRVYFRCYSTGTAFINWGGMTVWEIAQ